MRKERRAGRKAKRSRRRGRKKDKHGDINMINKYGGRSKTTDRSRQEITELSQRFPLQETL